MTPEERIRRLEAQMLVHTAMHNATNMALSTVVGIVGANPAIGSQKLYDHLCEMLRKPFEHAMKTDLSGPETEAILDETLKTIEIMLSLFKTQLGAK